jgi:enolase
MPRLERIHAREVLDSRGRPTVEVEVQLASGHEARAIVPSGASTGRSEAVELRDRDPARYRGYGVRKAVAHVNQVIAPAVRGMDAREQAALDEALIQLDGTPDKGRLGANAILGVSLAAARAGAACSGVPLYRYIRLPGRSPTLPMPMVNILSGGLHAQQVLEMQDFLVIPVGAPTYSRALEMVHDVWHGAHDLFASRPRGAPAGIADEGGFPAAFATHREALSFLTRAIEAAGFRPGTEVAIAIDVASSHFFREGAYHLREFPPLDAAGMADLLAGWTAEFPVISIEDGAAEDDWEGWAALGRRLGSGVQLLGDDLFTTNPDRLARGVREGVANAVLIKPNQIGTLTETLRVMEAAHAAGYRCVVSARSGDTEDPLLADLAVATGAGQIKIGSVTRSERLAKYNQLLRIEEALGPDAPFATSVFR